MPINAADYFKRLKLLEPPPDAPQNTSQLGLKVPQSPLMSRITRGNSDPYAEGGGVANAPEGVSLSIPSGMPENSMRAGDETSALENRAPFRLGSANTGLLGNVEARQMANSAGLPSAGVRDGGITPPKMHHGFWDRLKSVGEGALMGMGQIAEQNARSGREQSLESLIGGAAGGGITGGVSPLSIDALRNRKQGEQDEVALARQQGLEEQQANIGVKQAQPILRALELKNDAEYHRETQRIQREVEAGRMTRAEADRRSREVEAKWGRDSREGIAAANRKSQEGIEARKLGRSTDEAGALAEKSRGREKLIQSNIDALNTNLSDIQQQMQNEPLDEAGAPTNKAHYDYLKGELDRTQKLIDSATKERNDAAVDAEKEESKLTKFTPKSQGGWYTRAKGAGNGGLNATEQKIYDAAKLSNLDPDEAVKRYRSGKY